MKRRSFFKSLLAITAAPAIPVVSKPAAEPFIAWMPATEIVELEYGVVFYAGRFYRLQTKNGQYGWWLLDDSWHWIDHGSVARMITCSRCYHDHGHDQWCYRMQQYEKKGVL